MLYRPTFTKPISSGAEFFARKGERFARWKDGRGRTRTARVTTTRAGEDRLLFVSPFWRFRFRDAAGVVKDIPTGCRDEVAAQGVANDLRRRAELVKAGTIKPAEDAVADHAKLPLHGHFEAYRNHLKAKGVTANHWKDTFSRLQRITADCSFRNLADLSAEALDKWLVSRTSEGMSASTRNAYRESLVSFGNWCVNSDRLTFNPFIRVPKADEKSDPRRQRRSMTEDELHRLLYVARHRPLAEFGRESTSRPDAQRGGNRRNSWFKAALTLDNIAQAEQKARIMLAEKPDLIADLENTGRERELLYKAFVLTGLRKRELASLTVAQLDLEAMVPSAVLNAADEKNQQGHEIPLRDDLAEDIRSWLADKLKALQQAARLRIDGAIPLKLPGEMPLFNVPSGLLRILNRDLVAAGIAQRVKVGAKWTIAKRDERGRTIDIHALRHTFATHLSKGGVPLRTAQAAMRHSTPTLTANVYTDPKLLDVRGALNVLPMLPLGGALKREKAKATGTSGAACQNDASALASVIALKTGNRSTNGGKSNHEGVLCSDRGLRSEAVVSGRSGNRNGSQSTSDGWATM